MPIWSMLSTQNSSSPMMEMLIFFHDYVSIMMIMIIMFVTHNISTILHNKANFSMLFWDNHTLENFWLAVPVMILISLGFPSIKNLYMSEEMCNPAVTFKAMASQWFWSYSSEHIPFNEYDANMSESTMFRLLSTNNHLILPSATVIRLMVSSNDVIHSWTVPALGVKVDATPGRVNQLFVVINRPGLYTGQCSEICGINHSFMPITISAMTQMNYINSL